MNDPRERLEQRLTEAIENGEISEQDAREEMREYDRAEDEQEGE